LSEIWGVNDGIWLMAVMEANGDGVLTTDDLVGWVRI
jgi:hypothetical protein